MISVPKAEWKSGLEKAIDYYVETEEYEECSKIKDLINKLWRTECVPEMVI